MTTMRAHKIDSNGRIVNTIVIGSLAGRPDLIDASIGGGIGDSVVNGALVPATPVVVIPTEVTMRQARLALLGANLLASVDAAIAALSEPAKSAALIEWEYSSAVQRHNGFVSLLAPALGLTEGQLDDLFIAAAQL